MKLPGLLVTSGPKKGIYLDIPNQKPFWIGRSNDVDFCPEKNPNISSKHCYFLRREKELAVKDESLNGTYLNGRILHRQAALLKNADILCVGNTHFQVVDFEEPDSIATQIDIQACQKDFEERSLHIEERPFPQYIASYGLIEIIGHGAFGIVYKAIQIEKRQIVALKVFPQLEKKELEWVGRFFREIEILKVLDHPYIIKLYEEGYNPIEGSDSYLALEYFQGIDLYDYVDATGAIPWPEVLKILTQVSQALEYMHSKKILHRDLKPNNLLYHAKKQITKIIDFGLGKSLQLEERRTFFTTRPNSSIGTPNFMPLEQWSDLKSLDERADIYSLGATIYFLLSGRYPYNKNRSLSELYIDMIQHNLIPLANLCPQVPDSFLKIIEKMMEPEAKKRYPHIKAVLESLQKFAQEQNMPLP